MRVEHRQLGFVTRGHVTADRPRHGNTPQARGQEPLETPAMRMAACWRAPQCTGGLMAVEHMLRNGFFIREQRSLARGLGCTVYLWMDLFAIRSSTAALDSRISGGYTNRRTVPKKGPLPRPFCRVGHGRCNGCGRAGSSEM